MKMFRSFTVLVILVLALAGCGTIFSGGPDPLNFGSKPDGATVLVNGQSMGITPVTLKLEPNKTYMITYHKEGFEDANVTLNSHVQAGYVVLDVVVGLLGVAVDAATGDWKAFDQGQYFVELKAK
jgi:hypothetical protein